MQLHVIINHQPVLQPQKKNPNTLTLSPASFTSQRLKFIQLGSCTSSLTVKVVWDHFMLISLFGNVT